MDRGKPLTDEVDTELCLVVLVVTVETRQSRKLNGANVTIVSPLLQRRLASIRRNSTL
jgi:hypothetical protein